MSARDRVEITDEALDLADELEKVLVAGKDKVKSIISLQQAVEILSAKFCMSVARVGDRDMSHWVAGHVHTHVDQLIDHLVDHFEGKSHDDR